MNFPPFLRCTRTGNGDWRCNAMAAPGRSYCQRHYIEQKRRNERKRERKLGAIRRPIADGKRGKGGRSVEDDDDWRGNGRVSGRRAEKRRKREEEDESDGVDGSDESEEEVSETEYLMRRVLPHGKGVLHLEEDGEDGDDCDEEEVVEITGRWLRDSGKKKRNSGEVSTLSCERVLKRSAVGKRSLVCRKRRDLRNRTTNQGPMDEKCLSPESSSH